MNFSIPALYRLSYMWYSFLGTVLTVLFGLLISLVTERVSETKIINMTSKPNLNTEKPTGLVVDEPQHYKKESNQAVFIVENYRKKSQQLNGFDNIALKIEE